MALLNVVFPWSMCPMVPIFIWGFSRLYACFTAGGAASKTPLEVCNATKHWRWYKERPAQEIDFDKRNGIFDDVDAALPVIKQRIAAINNSKYNVKSQNSRERTEYQSYLTRR